MIRRALRNKTTYIIAPFVIAALSLGVFWGFSDEVRANEDVAIEEIEEETEDNPLDQEEHSVQSLPIWSQDEPYVVYEGAASKHVFKSLEEAVSYAKSYGHPYVWNMLEGRLMWTNYDREIYFTEDTNQGDLFLVNKYYPIGASYEPSEMFNLADERGAYLRVSREDMLVEKVLVESMKSMLKSAQEEGLNNIILVSTYRSFTRQQGLFDNQINRLLDTLTYEKAREKAATVVAIPGSSEHQTGLAVDFSVMLPQGGMMPLTEEIANTVEGKWIKDHSWKYGFVVRYGKDKMDITEIIYEPWHLRYVGVPHAEMMYRENLSLEEYLDFIQRERRLFYEDVNQYQFEVLYFDSIYSQELRSFLDSKDNIYAISGDGKSGIIVTVKIN